MTIPGPCVICGGTNYELSMGGPTICPSCDCGPPNPRQVREMREALTTNITKLRALVAELAASLAHIAGLADYADEVTKAGVVDRAHIKALRQASNMARAALAKAEQDRTTL